MTSQNKRRDLNDRQSRKMRYNKRFLVACEGSKTEPDYLSILGHRNRDICVHPQSRKGKSSPEQVLKQMTSLIKEQKLDEIVLDDLTEAWVAIDRDRLSDEQLQKLYKWSKKSEKYHVAITNPKFEFWLLLHFEDAKKLNSPSTYNKKLTDHLGRPYKKHIKENDITDEQIKLAIERATQRDDPPCESWPHNHGTTIYRLVEKLIEKK